MMSSTWHKKDSDHCTALHHEFLQCEEAFHSFNKLKTEIPLYGYSRYLSYQLYNAYARYIFHLYEFLIGALRREIELKLRQRPDGKLKIIFLGKKKTSNDERLKQIECLIYDLAHNATRQHGNGTVSPEFAAIFRQYRNKIAGHVSYERAELDLTEFYVKYDDVLTAIFTHCQSHWGIERQEKFPDLKQITKFFMNFESTSKNKNDNV